VTDTQTDTTTAYIRIASRSNQYIKYISPSLLACTLNKKNNIKNNGLLAYTFTKFGDKLTKNNRYILIANSNST